MSNPEVNDIHNLENQVERQNKFVLKFLNTFEFNINQIIKAESIEEL